jgi:hypothetical protein
MRLMLTALLAVTVLNAQNYSVHLAAPQRAGLRYKVSTTGSRTDRATIGDRVMKPSEYQVNFQGTADILELDSKLRPFRINFAVERFTRIEDGVTTDLLTPGSVIVFDGSRQEPISLRDGALQQSVGEAFRLVHSTYKPGDVSDDDVFGTKELKSIGDSWPINSTFASENLKSTGITVPPDRLTGTVSLVARDKVDATDCLSFRGSLAADGFTLAETDLPPGVTMGQGSLHAAISGCFPLSDSGLSYREGADINVHIRVSSSQGDIDVTYVQKQEEVWVALKR